MATFTDATGQEWAVGLKFGHLKTLREKHGIDTKGKAKDFLSGVGEAIGEPERLYGLLILLCADEIKARGLDPESFAMLLDGGTLRRASAAVAEALLDFCQGPTVGRETGESVRAAMATVDQRMGADLKALTPTLISKLRDGNWPDSAGAPTPTREASAS